MLMHLQDTRYSMGYFLWPRHHDKIQGRKGLYPPITMAEFMKTKGVRIAASLVPGSLLRSSSGLSHGILDKKWDPLAAAT